MVDDKSEEWQLKSVLTSGIWSLLLKFNGYINYTHQDYKMKNSPVEDLSLKVSC